MDIKVVFYGVLAEVTDTHFKFYRNVKSMDDLRLSMEVDFPELVHYNFRISHNRVLVDNAAELKDGDEIALLPPFAGG